MRRCVVIAVVACVLLPACDSSIIGLIPFSGIELLGFKLYLGMQLLGVGAKLTRNIPTLSGENDHEDPTSTTKRPSHLHRRATSSSRSLNAFTTLNPEILKFIHQIDDDQCFEKFFCQLGADRGAFGSFGLNLALMLEFSVSDRSSWYTKAMENGRKIHRKELCPGRCESDDIKKIADYLSKRIFSNR